MAEITAALLAAAKNYLDITWADADGDVKLTGILARGEKYLNGTVGATLDFESEGKPQELLLEYARYVRNNALQYFRQDFLAELYALKWEVEGDGT